MSEKKILIVDDHEDTRFVLSTVLDHGGYRVVEARDGEEGISIAIREIPDLILIDIRLPGLDGFKATESIRSHPDLKEVPVVAVTADVFDPETQPRADGLFHSCLFKPLRPKELLDNVRNIIGDP